MTPFITEDFLLLNKTARILYHEYAKEMPIYDYHSHLPEGDIDSNKKFKNMTEAWLDGDHYKWRGMRANGVAEKYISGNASDLEKFVAWSKTVPYTMRNPLYHWTHLELKKPFGLDGILLNGENAQSVYEQCNEMLLQDAFSTRGILKQWNVKLVCTTNDPLDDLQPHKNLKQENYEVTVLPTFRPDRVVSIEQMDFLEYLKSLEISTSCEITSPDTLLEAIQIRHDYFHELGCRLSDYGLSQVYWEKYNSQDIESIFQKRRLQSGESTLSKVEVAQYHSWVLHELAKMDAKSGWTMQLHIGPIRNNNTKMFQRIGANTGFDSMGDSSYALELSQFLDSLDQIDLLPKTVLYNINPKDNYMLATMAGNFQEEGVPSKVQFGSGWWFLDQKQGMEDQMNCLSNMGLLSRFVGMLTDSRSFLSFSRHEYFRRILCNMIGQDVEHGVLPNDTSYLGKMVQNISFNNAVEYFGMEGMH